MGSEPEAPARDFPAVAARLRSIIEVHADGLLLSASPAGDVKLERPPGGHPWDYVAGIRVGKNYVSYYLMPVYGIPELLSGISPELRRRMQGKACFNFTRVDEPLFDELATLTATGIDRFRSWQPPDRRR
jgi:hypothetical protein